MVITDVIALVLAPLWAAFKDRVPIGPVWHPWIITGVCGLLLAGATALGMNGSVGWSAELFWQAVTIVGSVFTGYTVAKPVETVGAPAGPSKVAVALLLACLLVPLGVVLADPALVDTLTSDPPVPAEAVSEGLAKTVAFWFGIIGGILARIIRRKIG